MTRKHYPDPDDWHDDGYGSDPDIVRIFPSGASRDRAEEKPDYEAFISPLVIYRFGEYMHKHRKLADGSLRAGDNWQGGFGDDNDGVCLKSMWRHMLDLWLSYRGWGQLAREVMEESLCAIIFNAMAMLHGQLVKRYKNGQQ